MHPVPTNATPASRIAINTFVIFIFANSLSARGRNRRALFAHGSDGLNALAHTDWHEPGTHDANDPIMATLPDRVVMIVTIAVPMSVNMNRRRNDPAHGCWMDNHRRRRNNHGRRAIMVIMPQQNAEAEPIGTRVHGGYG